MNLILDSHAFLWALGDDPALGRQVRAALERDDVRVSLSTATVWELGIKHSLGRLHLPVTLREMLATAVAARMRVLPIVPEHALRAADLPHHHADPFDRLLIAQALAEGLIVASRDRKFAAYGVECLW